MTDKEKDNFFPKKDREASGRVVDLKKMSKEERKNILLQKGSRDLDFSPKRKGLFAFDKKDKNTDFLKKYEVVDEPFDERELLADFEEPKPKKKNILLLFFSLIIRALKLWWLPLFLIKFILLLFWRTILLLIFRRKTWDDKVRIKVVGEEEKKKERPKKIIVKVKPKKNIFLRFVRFIWLILAKIKNFFFGTRREDYLYQQALFEEVVRKKFNPVKHLLAFSVLIALLALPFKVFCDYSLIDLDGLRGRVLGTSEKAIDSLGQAVASVTDMDLGEASYNFFLARDGFSQALGHLEEINGFLFVLAKFVPNEEMRLAGASKQILAAGELASNLGRNLSLAFDSFLKNGEEEKISQKLASFIEYLSGAIEDARGLNQELEKIDKEALPYEYQDGFALLKEKSRDLEDILVEMGEIVEKINVFLGAESDKRYLFVFQNNNEARAPGGFIGSFALVDFSQGGIKNVEVPGGGSYDTEGGLAKLVVSPEPLHLVDPLWHFWDANWWPDWEKSARKLMWFYGKSGGPTVDGVISFTPTVLERFLKITGPIDMTETHGMVIDADNFWDNIREVIEKEKQESNLSYEEAEKKPKKIIGELLTRILKELPSRLNKDSFVKLLVNLEKSLEEKHVLFYFTDNELQAEAEKRNWAGEIKETNKNYLAVINTNIAGGKSDGRMQEVIDHQVEIMPDGTIINNLTIEKKHTGTIDEPFYGVRNVNWMRIYVPLGSKLLKASGFRGPDPIYFEYPEESWEGDPDVLAEEEEAVIDRQNNNTKVYNESGKTVFANWTMVDPGQSITVKLKYQLPFKLEKREVEVEEDKFTEIFNKLFQVEQKDLFAYSLLVQKQAGARFSTINSSLELPDDFKIVWKYPKNLALEDNGWDFGKDLNTDGYWAVVMEAVEE